MDLFSKKEFQMQLSLISRNVYRIQVNLDMTDYCKTDYSSMTDKMLGPSPMHIKYLPYVYDRFCI